MPFRVRCFSAVLIILSLFFPLLIISSAKAESNLYGFDSPDFATLWNHNDKLVFDNGATIAGRGYTWGLNAPGNAGYVNSELYAGKPRLVQYFDKARMELANSDTPNTGSVTTGLLVKELVTGNRQDGDNTFTTLAPSIVQIAGDPNDKGTNSSAPTYASFKNVVTFFGHENGKPQATGSVVNARIDKAGTVSTFTPPEQRLLTAYDPNTQHNIADIFADFENQTGQVWSGDHYVQAKVFGDNPTLFFGRPVTDPYWVRTVIKGMPNVDVMVQLFERRVLTYTSVNPQGSKVEMGNVGQHYYRWRYEQNNGLPIPPFPGDFSQLQAGYNHDNGTLPVGGNANIVTYVTPRAASVANNNALSFGTTDPVISPDGSVIVVGSRSGVIAINTATMTTKWIYPAPVTEYYIPSFSRPMLYDGIVYVYRNGILYALNLADGTLKWQIQTPGYPNGEPITDGNNLYFPVNFDTYGSHGTGYSQTSLVAVRLDTGKLIWQTPEVGGRSTTPIFGFDGNIYYRTFGPGPDGEYNKVVAYTVKGTAVAGFNTPQVGYGYSQIAFANNRIYVGGSQLYALDNTGKIVDSTNLQIDNVTDTPAIVDGKVYFGTFVDRIGKIEGHFYAAAANNLKNIQFDIATNLPVSSSPAVVNNHVFVGIDTYLDTNSRKGELYMIDAANTSNRKVLLTAQDFSSSSPLVFNGQLYIGNNNSNFYAIK